MKILMIGTILGQGTPFSEFFRIKALTELGHTIDLATYPIGKMWKLQNEDLQSHASRYFTRSPSTLDREDFSISLFHGSGCQESIRLHTLTKKPVSWAQFTANLWKIPHV